MKQLPILVLKGVLLWEHPYVVYMCPVALVGELDLKWAQTASFPGVCWQQVGLELEQPEPEAEPGVSQSFSYSQWPLLPYWGKWQGLRGWNRSPEGVGFLLGVMVVSALVEVLVGA